MDPDSGCERAFLLLRRERLGPGHSERLKMDQQGQVDPTSQDELKAHIAVTLPVLGVMGIQLKETANQIESAVVEVCGKFQSMAARARAGVSGAAELLSGGSDSQSSSSVESLIAEASRTIETLLRHTQDSAAVSNSAIERIKRVQEATDHISKSLSQLDDITIGNRLLAVNARIQAVYAGDKAAGFGGVANEIGVQAKRSAEIVELIRSVSSELRYIASSALTDLQSMVVEDQKAYLRSKVEVDRVLAGFRFMHNSTREFISKMQAESESVAKEISGAVRSLQFQDRISQRIGHVVAELDRIKADLGAHCAGMEMDEQQILRHLSQSYTMQEERNVLDGSQQEVVSGDLELF
jgi:methyl-accepting chemotaxis protein